MKLKNFLLALAVVVTAFSASGKTANSVSLSTTFDAHAVRVSGATPNGSVAILGVAKEWEYRSYKFVHWQAVIKADATGAATLDLSGRDVVDTSVWAVVDVTSGSYSISAPNSASLNAADFGSAPLAQDGAGHYYKLTVPFDLARTLVVRPQVGAWGSTVSDGGSADETNVPDGVTAVLPQQTAAISKSGAAPPSTFQEGDVVIVIDPRSLRYNVTVVGAR